MEIMIIKIIPDKPMKDVHAIRYLTNIDQPSE